MGGAADIRVPRVVAADNRLAVAEDNRSAAVAADSRPEAAEDGNRRQEAAVAGIHREVGVVDRSSDLQT
jgi:hypothetical protein